jgi:hypothetical protein
LFMPAPGNVYRSGYVTGLSCPQKASMAICGHAAGAQRIGGKNGGGARN